MNIIQSFWRKFARREIVVPLVIVFVSLCELLFPALQKIILPETLLVALIAAMAVDQMVERLNLWDKTLSRLDSVHEALGNIQSRLSVRASLFFESRMSRTQQQGMMRCIEEARSSIDVCGITLYRLMGGEYDDILLSKAAAGCAIRFVVVSPQDELLRQTTAFSPDVDDPLEHKRDIENTLDTAKKLRQRANGNFEIRMSKSIPIAGMLIIDKDDATYGAIYVELYLYKTQIRDRPCFSIRACEDPSWYKIFRDHYTEWWEDAVPPSVGSEET